MTSKRKRNTRKTDDEDRKARQRMYDRRTIQVRLNDKERSLLESSMRKEGWTNKNGFIRYRLFGLDPDQKVERMIEGKNPDDLVILLKNGTLELAEYFLYFYSRYEKDMAQLWKEEGVDMNAWTSATNRWHSEVAKRIEQYFATSRKIAAALGLEEYFRLPSEAMNPTWDATTEEMDAVAGQLRKERIAMGRLEEM